MHAASLVSACMHRDTALTTALTSNCSSTPTPHHHRHHTRTPTNCAGPLEPAGDEDVDDIFEGFGVGDDDDFALPGPTLTKKPAQKTQTKSGAVVCSLLLVLAHPMFSGHACRGFWQPASQPGQG